ncbi:MAG: sulfatase activating formylglycine-generating enzyme [Planctomycetota bacterium]|jgi:formylglycine-generating enzyme required for sulfatase activity
MNSSDPERSLEGQAIDLFAKFLEHESGDQADGDKQNFDKFCKEHPRFEVELRRLQANLAELDGFLVPQTGGVTKGEASLSAKQNSMLDGLSGTGKSADRYSIEGEVGHGGMGVVMRTWDAQLQRSIAMKLLRNSEGAGSGTSKLDPRRVRRFLEEGQITGQLDHPGVVPVHELGLDKEGRLFFTMRLVRGRDLRAIIDLSRKEQDGWNLARALSALQRVCETMAFAHEHGVIHRDLKPANIMVGSHGETYVMDWGLAKVLDRSKLHGHSSEDVAFGKSDSAELGEFEADALLTHDGTVVGTPSYMPPEQGRGDLKQIGPQSDVYSVGAMLYHLLQGEPPFYDSKKGSSGSRILEQLLVGPPKPLDFNANVIPVELAAICERAMSRAPSDRYADMGEMGKDLRAYLEGRVVQAYRTGAIAEFRTWTKRNRGMAASIAAGIVIAIGGLTSTAVVQSRANDVLESKNTELSIARADAVSEAKRAKENEERALVSERLANEGRVKVMRLADLEQLEELRNSEKALYPARPSQVVALQAWLEKANTLAERLPLHLSDLESLRGQALMTNDEQSTGDETMALRFESNEQQWHYNQLEKLTAEAAEVFSPDSGLRDRVQKRFDFASSVEELTLTSAEAIECWNEAIRSISNADESPRYRGLVIEPLIGLLPIGQSEHSGLWEFLLVETGAEPELQIDGSFALSESTGVVLVLVPGGTFTMGARRPSAQFPIGAPFVDPFSDISESPLNTIELDPFYISKYELTQGQWNRLAGFNPSVCKAGSSGEFIEGYTWLNPVDNLTHIEAREVLGQFGMTLPSEAQWEYSARADTSSVFWTGNDSASMNGASNCADNTWGTAPRRTGTGAYESWTDGWIGSAPVGSYYPNPFGLHDTAGNLWEWCLDMTHSYKSDLIPGTGQSVSGNDKYRVVRGGSFNEVAENLRSALREQLGVDARSLDVGVRPIVLIK